jgi:hypothetical protein
MAMEERRINRILTAYWTELKGKRSYPSEKEINPDALKDIWDCCFMLKITGGSFQQPDYTPVYMGQNIITIHESTHADNEIYRQLMQPPYGQVYRQAKKMLVTRIPMVDEGEFANSNNMMVKYRLCVMPLGENDAIDHILGGVRWLAY